MGTESDSVIRAARTRKKCCRCGITIRTGESYLSYAPGQRTRLPYCLICMKAHPALACLGAVLNYQTTHSP